MAGLIRDEAGRVLLTRRPPGRVRAGLWEFPGGKVRPGESPEEALERELREELGLEVRVIREVARVRHAYPELTIELLLFEVEAWNSPRSLENQEIGWFYPERLENIPLCPADRELLALLLPKF